MIVCASRLCDVFYLFIWTFASEHVFMYSALKLREKQQRNALKLNTLNICVRPYCAIAAASSRRCRRRRETQIYFYKKKKKTRKVKCQNFCMRNNSNHTIHTSPETICARFTSTFSY